MKSEDVEKFIDNFFYQIMNFSAGIKPLLGYTVIIASILVMFPTENGRNFAIKLADALVPLTFFVFGGVLVDLVEHLFKRR